jgi:hypothetical protein
LQEAAMRTFAQRQNLSQQPGAFNFAGSGAAEPAAFPKDAELVEDSAPAAVMDFAHDFSRIPVSVRPQATIQPKLTVSSPDGTYEQEADHAASQVMRMPEPQRHRADDSSRGAFESGDRQAPLTLLVQNRPMMLMRQPDDKTQAQKQPAPAQPQKQPAPAQQGLCSKVNLSALKLPRKIMAVRNSLKPRSTAYGFWWPCPQHRPAQFKEISKKWPLI